MTERVYNKVRLILLVSALCFAVNINAHQTKAEKKTPVAQEKNEVFVSSDLTEADNPTSSNDKSNQAKKGSNTSASGLDENFLIYLGEIQEIKDELVDPIALNEGLAKNKNVTNSVSNPLVSDSVVNANQCLKDCGTGTDSKINKDSQREINYEN